MSSRARSRAHPIGVAVIVGSIAACGEGTLLGIGAAEPNARAAGRVELSVTPSRMEVAAGDTLSIRVTVRNRSRDAVQLDPGGCTPLGYEVRQRTGQRVAASGFESCGFVGGDAPTYRLDAGASATVVLRWAAIHGYSTTGTNAHPQAGQPLPPGSYEVLGGLISTQDSAAFVARSEPVAITVTSVRTSSIGPRAP